MAASLSTGIAWSEDLFSASFTNVAKLRRRTKHRISMQRSKQFDDQAWSIVLFLIGEQAPEARKAAFRALLKDKRSKSHHAEAFLHHFGFGFATLLESWRQWVFDQVTRTDNPASPHSGVVSA